MHAKSLERSLDEWAAYAEAYEALLAAPHWLPTALAQEWRSLRRALILSEPCAIGTKIHAAARLYAIEVAHRV